jgi:hypothetical protein
MIDSLFRDIDRGWRSSGNTKTRLRIIGSTALMLQSSYSRGTKDSDVLQTTHLNEDVKAQLCALAGVGTVLHKKHRLYVDVVAAAIPFLPQVPSCHALHDLSASLEHFELEVLDIADVVVSKLKRFNPSDVADIEAMVERELVPHDTLIDRFRNAAEWYGMDARGTDLPKYIENLHVVERDMLTVPETEIALPDWI